MALKMMDSRPAEAPESNSLNDKESYFTIFIDDIY
jgi:hypothetical protein